jgi:hypothetical protein
MKPIKVYGSTLACDYESAQEERLASRAEHETYDRCYKMRSNKIYGQIMALQGKGASPPKKEK